jgi:hypothetical protein
MLKAMAEFAIAEAQKGPLLSTEMKWTSFLNPCLNQGGAATAAV